MLTVKVYLHGKRYISILSEQQQTRKFLSFA